MRLNGKNSKLVYDAPRFPLHTYTLAVWMKPEGLRPDGRRWHHVASAWCAGLNDPLRLTVQDGKLAVCIEQSGAGARTKAIDVENDKWLHVAVVKRYQDLTLYVNGRRTASILVPARFEHGAKNLGVGCNPNFGDTESFRGCLAEVLFSREALTDADIAALAAR